MSIHDNICEIAKSPCIPQYMALNEMGNMDCDIQVINCGDDVYILRSKKGESYWQQHNQETAYHSDMLCEMTDFAQEKINRKKNNE